MKIEMRALSEIAPYEKNPRQNDHAVEAVAVSIRDFGFRVICPPGTSPAAGLVFGGKDAFKGLEDGRHRQAVHGGTDREQAA